MTNAAFRLPDSHTFTAPRPSLSSEAPLKPFAYDTPDDLDQLFRICTTLNDPAIPSVPSLPWQEAASPLQEDADEDEVEYTFATLEDLPHQDRREPSSQLNTMRQLWLSSATGHSDPSCDLTAQQSIQQSEVVDYGGSDEEDEEDIDDEESPPFDLPELDYIDSAPGTPLPDRDLECDFPVSSSEVAPHIAEGAATPRARAADPLAAHINWSAYGFDFGLNSGIGGSGDIFDWNVYQDKAKDAYAESSGFSFQRQGDIADAEWELALAFANGDTVMGNPGPYDSAGLFGPPPGLGELTDKSCASTDDGWALPSGSAAQPLDLPFESHTQHNNAQLPPQFCSKLFPPDQVQQAPMNPLSLPTWPTLDPSTVNNPFACYPDPFDITSTPAAPWTNELVEPSPALSALYDLAQHNLQVDRCDSSTATSQSTPSPIQAATATALAEPPRARHSDPVLKIVSNVQPKKSSHHGRSVRTMPQSLIGNKGGKPKSSTSSSTTAATRKRNRAPERPKTLYCSHCPRSFSRPYNLRAHEETHLGVRKHICPVCLFIYDKGLAADDESDLNGNDGGNESIKKYARKHDLARHLDAVHEEFLRLLGVDLHEASQEGWRVPPGVVVSDS